MPSINKDRTFLPFVFSVSSLQAFDTNVFEYALRNIYLRIPTYEYKIRSIPVLRMK